MLVLYTTHRTQVNESILLRQEVKGVLSKTTEKEKKLMYMENISVSDYRMMFVHKKISLFCA